MNEELDDLLDYIYENGTAAEGVDRLAMKLCSVVRNVALDEAIAVVDSYQVLESVSDEIRALKEGTQENGK